MKTLLTGFDRFGRLERNPSQLIVEHIGRRTKDLGLGQLTVEILPTEFAAAGSRITQLIREVRPARVLCLGVAQGIEAIHLERVALNLDDTESPDNAGRAHRGTFIVPGGPAAHWSTLPIEQMRLDLQQHGIPARISNHAGTYVCNHVFYLARHTVDLLALPCACGFIHVPDIAEPGQPRPGLPLETMIQAIELCLKPPPPARVPESNRADSR